MSDIFDYIKQEQQQKSKRDGIVEGILAAIDGNVISKGDRIPSVNRLIQKLGVARMTVVKALNVLKDRGIIVSEDKVGYFVRDDNVKRELKVFLFLTGFYSYHETLYNQIIENVKDPLITIDLYFHHCNPGIFKSVLQENFGGYGLYVITGFENSIVKALLSRIPQKKLLQIIRPPVLEGGASVCQDFGAGLKSSLTKLKNQLDRYERFILVFPLGKSHPEEIKTTFVEFCQENGINWVIEKEITRDLTKKGTAFWVIEDSDLISLIKLVEEMSLRLGNEIGILSYNETPMKEIIRNGITVISVDFAQMGCTIADFISNPKYTRELFAPDVIIRNSL
jgi:biotin operon repressor